MLQGLTTDQGVQPVVNRWLSPTGTLYRTYTTGTGGAITTAFTDDTFTGGKWYELTWTTGATGVGGGLTLNGTSVPQHVTPLKQHVFSLWVMSSVAQSVKIAVGWRTEAGQGVGSQSSSGAFTLTAGVYTRISHAAIPPATATRIVLEVNNAVTGGVAWPTGAKLTSGRVMITEGPTLYEYSDGTTPGWKWLGTAGQSQSVGWPYKLETIAGAPLLMAVGAVADQSASGVAAFQGRTLYTVYDTSSDFSASYGTISRLGGTQLSEGRMSIRTGAANSSSMSSRWDTLNGTSNSGYSAPSTRNAGRHIGVISITDDMTQPYTRYDNGNYVTPGAILPGDGMPQFRLGTSFTSAYSNVFSIAFPKWHDAATVDRIMRWLANKYGVPLS